jgi:hypothetical protein
MVKHVIIGKSWERGKQLHNRIRNQLRYECQLKTNVMDWQGRAGLTVLWFLKENGRSKLLDKKMLRFSLIVTKI